MSLRTTSILNTAETRLTTLLAEQDDTRIQHTGSGDDPEQRDNSSGCEDSNGMKNTVGYILLNILVVIKAFHVFVWLTGDSIYMNSCGKIHLFFATQHLDKTAIIRVYIILKTSNFRFSSTFRTNWIKRSLLRRKCKRQKSLSRYQRLQIFLSII